MLLAASLLLVAAALVAAGFAIPVLWYVAVLAAVLALFCVAPVPRIPGAR